MFSLSAQNVIQYLIDTGLLSSEDLASTFFESQESGKNFNLLVSLTHNRKRLIKQERPGYDGETANEFFNEWLYYKFQERFTNLKEISTLASMLLHFDEPNSILVYNYLTDYEDNRSFFYEKQIFPLAIPTILGSALAKLHSLTYNQQECHDFITQTLEGKKNYYSGNPAKVIGRRISPEIFGTITIDCLNFYALYQRYESLEASVNELANNWNPCCLIHNDVKLENILVHTEIEESSEAKDGIVKLIDWECCTWGDPACDLGKVLASYVRIWLDSLVIDLTIKLEESLRMATTPLNLLQPSMFTLIQSYFNSWTAILEYCPEFFKRVIQFVGLFLIEQIQSEIQYNKNFDNKGICTLQVAKTLLTKPLESSSTLFGVPTSEVSLKIPLPS
jgi:serine/threonine protein kinase